MSVSLTQLIFMTVVLNTFPYFEEFVHFKHIFESIFISTTHTSTTLEQRVKFWFRVLIKNDFTSNHFAENIVETALK